MGKRLALLVGVSEYGEGFDPLPGSLKDVEAMESVLQDSDRGAFEVRSLKNCDSKILQIRVEQFFNDKDSDDVLLLYFSGHGDLGRGGMLHQQLHLCTCNTSKQQGRLAEAKAVSAVFLKRQMDLSRSQQIVVILDCCYSGAIADLLKKGEEDIDYGELKARGRVILASSSAAKVALQAVDGLSLYTRYLIEGMEGAAYSGQGTWIAAQDLHTYADRRFEIESKGGYTPKIIAEDTGFNLPIVRAPKPDAKLEYRKAVDRIFQELDQREGLAFNGEITEPLVRYRLEVSQRRLILSLEEARQIEIEVQTPYQSRAQKRQDYAEAFEIAVQGGCLPNDYDRQLLTEICQDLALGEEDADRIEQELTQRLNLKPVPTASQVTESTTETKTTQTSRYQALEEYLKNQQWKEADKETYRLMITTVGKKEGQWFEREELLNFPCDELKSIDQLWVKHSRGKFGFSVQKKIYVECGATLDGNYPGDKIYQTFGDLVGWREKGEWQSYADLKPSLSSPQGIFPFRCFRIRGWVGRVSGRWVLFSRAEACEM